MKKMLLFPAFLATVASGGLQKIFPSSSLENCTIRASVRAEDLAPSHISHGKLRVKMKEAHCTSQIASVALRLQLSEFGKVKHLRHGAVLPSIRRAENAHSPENFSDSNAKDTRYDYGPYDERPGFVVAKAEERTAWSTEVILLADNPGSRIFYHGRIFHKLPIDFSEPRVTPFLISSPAVNYPPSADNHRDVVGSRAIRRHGYSEVGYIYTAIINLSDGRTVEVPAGHTNFVPTSPPPPPQTPFSWNMTFAEHEPGREQLPSRQLDDLRRCPPEESRSVFTAEVTLEQGNVVQGGSILQNGGDPDYRKSVCQRTHASQGMSVDSYPWIFGKETAINISGGSGRLHADQPYFNFEVEVPPGTLPNFQTYYSSGGASLELHLDVVYSEAAATCIAGETYNNTYLAGWNAQREAIGAQSIHSLVILGAISAQPAEHYLTPDLPSPVLLAADFIIAAPEFPVLKPEIVREPHEMTAARLMQPGDTYAPQDQWRIRIAWFRRDIPDPLKRYQAGEYAGLLWEKKLVAMQRGLIPEPLEISGI
ncbi:hypothetical protein C8R43DRAFT_1203261 [Mycena crocata]|nr:hypothetical protein C8R43DRAFT_1203261 [Mycena crocata]